MASQQQQQVVQQEVDQQEVELEEDESDARHFATHHRFWKPLCALQFVLATCAGLHWFNYNVALNLIAFFYINNHSTSTSTTTTTTKHNFDASRIGLFFYVTVLSYVLDISYLVIQFNAGTVYVHSKLPHLAPMVLIAWIAAFLHALLKLVFMKWLSNIRVELRTESQSLEAVAAH